MTLAAQAVTVRVSGKTLLQDVDISVCAGEIVALVGPNGAGKSTLLRVLSGDVVPQDGTVYMSEQPLAKWRLADRARVRGILAQSSSLNFAFTVLQVVLMGRGPHARGRETRKDYEIVRAALDAAEIHHLENRLYTTLSGGERQRVQLARVLAQIWEAQPGQTRYLLMDEPTNNLDLNHQHRTLQIARKFAHEGVAVLVILHDLNLAAQYADQIVLLKQGVVTATGSPHDVLTADNIEAAFAMSVMVTQHPLLDSPLIVPIADSKISAAKSHSPQATEKEYDRR